jgi:hypothetical protein
MSTSYPFMPVFINNTTSFFVDSGNTKSYIGSGSSWVDLSSYSNNSTLVNTPTFTNTRGGILSFDGSTEYATVPYSDQFDLSVNFTLEAWFNMIGSGGTIISKDTNGLNFDWCIYMLNSTTIGIYSNGGTTNVSASSLPSLNDGLFHHCVITGTSGFIEIYLDGKLVGSGSMSISNASTTGTFVTIGCVSWNSPSLFFNGSIPIVRVYRDGLTSSKVLQNYNATKNRFI